ncbi:DUF6470 family protein [Aquibacillus salsiterrae]|uniref:DUF6470 family protein n=1 Tax=Aquibacillus salsiterrae TaxID=2950439 RepID=A0A9X3WC62_9BACI|nr:DUF6470 family protein [Aquibacillus salsiterrae]MDC3416128.1 DUF6470 family protein [Aquibacillus salsiterrae]
MELAQIRMQSQMAKLTLNRASPVQSIEQPGPIVSIEQPKGELTINRTPSKLTIDQSQAWYDMDLKSAPVRTREAAQLGKRDVLKGIARRARQGEELMKIENGGNPIVSQAVENGFDPPKQFNIGWIPSPGSVKIDYQPSKVDISYQPRKPVIDIQAQKAITDYTPGSVEISLGQEKSLSIDFADLKYKGYRFETLI